MNETPPVTPTKCRSASEAGIDVTPNSKRRKVTPTLDVFEKSEEKKNIGETNETLAKLEDVEHGDCSVNIWKMNDWIWISSYANYNIEIARKMTMTPKLASFIFTKIVENLLYLRYQIPLPYCQLFTRFENESKKSINKKGKKLLTAKRINALKLNMKKCKESAYDIMCQHIECYLNEKKNSNDNNDKSLLSNFLQIQFFIIFGKNPKKPKQFFAVKFYLDTSTKALEKWKNQSNTKDFTPKSEKKISLFVGQKLIAMSNDIVQKQMNHTECRIGCYTMVAKEMKNDRMNDNWVKKEENFAIKSANGDVAYSFNIFDCQISNQILLDQMQNDLKHLQLSHSQNVISQTVNQSEKLWYNPLWLMSKWKIQGFDF